MPFEDHAIIYTGPLTRARLKHILQEPSSIQVNCKLHPLVRKALEKEVQRECNALGDLEEGESLSYVLPLVESAHNHPPPSTPAIFSSMSIPLPALLSRNTAAVRRRRRERAEQRKLAAGELPRYKLRSSASRRHQAYRVIKSTHITAKLPVARGAYIGLRRATGTSLKSPEELAAEGYDYIAWDGRETVLLEDNDEKVIGVLAGHRLDPSFKRDLQSIDSVMKRAGNMLKFRAATNRRGAYRTIAVGVSYGGGQMLPGNLRHCKFNLNVLKTLLSHPAVNRIANYQSVILAQFAPKMYSDYHTKLSALLKQFPSLVWNFAKSIFPAASFNFGPNAVTLSHADHCNRAVGWCAITALGSYDPTRGGHLVLESFRLIIEFPPGATILIPSASCVHSNTPIQSGESRMAFTQYAAGGLFRFVDYGFKSWKKLEAEEPAVARKFQAERDARWAEELKLFSQTSELNKDRKACGITK